jgi:hypothetical protein
MIHDSQTMDIRYVAPQRSTLMVTVIPHKFVPSAEKTSASFFFPCKTKTGACFICLPILISIAGVHTIGLLGDDLASLLGVLACFCATQIRSIGCAIFFALVDSRLHDGVAFLDGFAAYFQGVFEREFSWP